MGFFSNDSSQANAYDQVYNQQQNEGSWGHELIAGAAAFAAARAYENHKEANGQPGSHAFAKELLAGFAGAEVDKLAETRGMDFADRERAKWEAQRQAQDVISQNNY